MVKVANRKIILIVLTGLFTIFAIFIMGQAVVSRAQDSKKPGQGNTSLYSTMLSHGQEAYKQGLHAKAGYYFLEAVKANPSGMAIMWYESISGTKGARKSFLKPAPAVIKPKKPATALPVKEIDPTKLGIIIGDDEGC